MDHKLKWKRAKMLSDMKVINELIPRDQFLGPLLSPSLFAPGLDNESPGSLPFTFRGGKKKREKRKDVCI